MKFKVGLFVCSALIASVAVASTKIVTPTTRFFQYNWQIKRGHPDPTIQFDGFRSGYEKVTVHVNDIDNRYGGPVPVKIVDNYGDSRCPDGDIAPGATCSMKLWFVGSPVTLTIKSHGDDGDPGFGTSGTYSITYHSGN
jgi:hypothetical protein